MKKENLDKVQVKILNSLERYRILGSGARRRFCHWDPAKASKYKYFLAEWVQPLSGFSTISQSQQTPQLNTDKCPTEQDKKLIAMGSDKNIENTYNQFMSYKERGCSRTVSHWSRIFVLLALIKQNKEHLNAL